MDIWPSSVGTGLKSDNGIRSPAISAVRHCLGLFSSFPSDQRNQSIREVLGWISPSAWSNEYRKVYHLVTFELSLLIYQRTLKTFFCMPPRAVLSPEAEFNACLLFEIVDSFRQQWVVCRKPRIWNFKILILSICVPASHISSLRRDKWVLGQDYESPGSGLSESCPRSHLSRF